MANILSGLHFLQQGEGEFHGKGMQDPCSLAPCHHSLGRVPPGRGRVISTPWVAVGRPLRPVSWGSLETLHDRTIQELPAVPSMVLTGVVEFGRCIFAGASKGEVGPSMLLNTL